MKALLLVNTLLITSPAIAFPLEGSWTNPAQNVTVRIGQCGKTLCGRVTAASPHAREKAAHAGTDKLVGAELMSDIERTGPESWRAEIFVPDHGVHSRGQIFLDGPQDMSVRGCALGVFICKSQTWTRVDALGTSRR